MPTLDFKGKQHIYAHHLTVPFRPLIPDHERSLNPSDGDDNLIIHGDNLHALKALLPRYASKVKCIYIDPPYNTGNEGWVYNDNVNSPMMREWVRENSPIDGEDLERHDKWLCMMWPRLHLLRELLADDGAIFVSIDDHEQHHLRLMMDEIFGDSAFKNSIIIRRGTKNVQSQFATIDSLSTGHDTLLLYSKSSELRLPKLMSIGDEASPGKWDTFWRGTDRPTMRYELFGVHPEEGQWRWAEQRAHNAVANYDLYCDQYEALYSLDEYFGLIKQEQGKDLDFVRFGPDQTVQYYVSPRNYTILSDVWMDIRTSGRLTDFPHEKHEELVKRMVKWLTNRHDIVLDSFAGSGTTGHAVLALNKEDGGNRKFILVECEDYADTLTAERVRRVIEGVPKAKDDALKEGLGGSFTYCTLGEPIDVEGMVTGKNLPEYGELASYLLHTASGLSARGSGELQDRNDDGLFYSNGDTDYYLLYRPDIAWLRSNEAILNEKQVHRIRERGKKAVVFAADKYMGQRFLTDMGVTFCQIPYELHRLS